MSNAEKNANKKIRETVARRKSQGWNAEQIGKRIWLCYGHLYMVKGTALIVKMAGGDQTFDVQEAR